MPSTFSLTVNDDCRASWRAYFAVAFYFGLWSLEAGKIHDDRDETSRERLWHLVVGPISLCFGFDTFSDVPPPHVRNPLSYRLRHFVQVGR